MNELLAIEMGLAAVSCGIAGRLVLERWLLVRAELQRAREPKLLGRLP